MATDTTSAEWSRVRAIDGPIPAPLPTMVQVCASRDVMSESNGRRIVGIGNHFVAKYGPTVSTTEADVLAWLEQSTTTIRAPKLYAVFKKTDRNTRELSICIIMERIHGYLLEDHWGMEGRGGDAKANFAVFLNRFLKALRALPPPETSTPYCNPMGGPLLDQMFLSPAAANGGPFKTEEELIGALINRARRTSMRREDVDELDQRARQLMSPNARPVFTHGHLRLDHIFFTPTYEKGICKRWEIVLVDWECAGWYASESNEHRPFSNCVQVPPTLGVRTGHVERGRRQLGF
jgi:hypothetical protein